MKRRGLKDVTKLQRLIVAAIEDIKGRDIRVFDTAHVTALFDRVIVATADSGRQMRAMARHIEDIAGECGISTARTEGQHSDDWVLVDLGDVVIHLFRPQARMHYNLESLWDQPRPRTARQGATAAADSAASRPRKRATSKPRPAKGSRNTKLAA